MRTDSLRVSVRCFWEPRDLWIGVFVKEPAMGRHRVYICPLPTLVILVEWDCREATDAANG